MSKRVLLAAAVWLFTVGVAVQAHAACSKDTDCKGDRVCDHGKCVAPSAVPTPVAAVVAVPPPAPVAQPVAPAPVPVEPAPPPVQAAVVPVVRTSTGEGVAFTFAPPPTWTLLFALGGTIYYMGQNGFNGGGGSLEMASHFIYGLTPFPDTHGGNWTGLVAQAFLAPGGGGGGGAPVNGSSGGFFHGPWLAAIFPTYDAHRAGLSYSYVDLQINFVGVFGSVVNQYVIGGGGAF
jgi:hypothetical protein